MMSMFYRISIIVILSLLYPTYANNFDRDYRTNISGDLVSRAEKNMELQAILARDRRIAGGVEVEVKKITLSYLMILIIQT